MGYLYFGNYDSFINVLSYKLQDSSPQLFKHSTDSIGVPAIIKFLLIDDECLADNEN